MDYNIPQSILHAVMVERDFWIRLPKADTTDTAADLLARTGNGSVDFGSK